MFLRDITSTQLLPAQQVREPAAWVATAPRVQLQGGQMCWPFSMILGAVSIAGLLPVWQWEAGGGRLGEGAAGATEAAREGESLPRQKNLKVLDLLGFVLEPDEPERCENAAGL